MIFRFEDIIKDVLDKEQGFVNSASDRGGATKYGITIKTMRDLNIDLDGDGDVDIEDVKLLTPDRAMDIYYHEFWKPSKVELLPVRLRHIYFDMYVNFGPRGAVRVLQMAVNSKLGVDKLKVDGILGPNTCREIDRCDVEINRVVDWRIYRYASIVVRFPDQFVNYHGWCNRARFFLQK